jgi:hypothetical protein
MKKYIDEANKQILAMDDVDGWGCPRAWVDVPGDEVAEITLMEDNRYSVLRHDKETGFPIFPYIEANSLEDLFKEILR